VKLLWRYFFLFFFCSCHFLEGKVTINNKSTVIYQKDATTPEEAKHLGDVLLSHGYFNTWDERMVYLNKKENQYQVTFVINKDLFLSDQENIVEGFKVWRQWIQEYAFGYAPTLLILADEQKHALYKIDGTTILKH
jgi:hypothetical protein